MRYLLLVILHSMVTSASAAKPIARVVIPSTLGEPLLIDIRDTKNPKGLVIDYIELLGKKMQHRIEFSFLPKYRIDTYVARGLMDFNCYTNPSWVPRPESFHWTDPLFTKKDVIVTYKVTPTSLSNFKGETIGAILGYRYPNLNPYFNSKSIVREDAPGEEANLLKLLSGRLSYAVIDNLFVDYYLKQHPQKDVSLRKIPVEEYEVRCALNKKSKISAEILNRAVSEIKNSQELLSIFDKYK